MRKLESIIAQFVDDLLLTIGEASVEELRELFASQPVGQRTASALPGPTRPSSTPASASAPPPRRSSQSPRTWADSSLAAPPPAIAEITDPESLLSLVSSHVAPALASITSLPSVASAFSSSSTPSSSSRSASSSGAVLLSLPTRVAVTEAHAEPEGESPASGIRPVGSAPTVRLSDNETLARVSNSGIVIRRKKKA